MKRDAQKQKRPVLAGTQRLPQETDPVYAGSILAQGPSGGNGKSAAVTPRHLVNEAHVVRLIPDALRRFRVQLAAQPSAAKAEQPELF